MAIATVTSFAQTRHPQAFKSLARFMNDEWYAQPEAQQAADSAMHYQYPCGGWAKNHDWHTAENDAKMAERQGILRQIALGESVGATFDNGATMHEMMLLARVYEACSNQRTAKRSYLRRLKKAFERGLDYIIEAQYENGGWPQFYPPKPADNEGHPFYSAHITFNDDAMVNTMQLLRNIYEGQAPYGALNLSEEQKQKSKNAFEKGIQCILDCQIKKDGRLTVWCQQHDEQTLLPAPARAYELVSFTGSHETASILSLLMSLEEPSDSVVQAVTAAVEWLEEHTLRDVKIEYFTNADGQRDRRIVHSFGHNLWARYYDLETEEPYVCDRDGVPQPSLEYIGYERRNGYGWYGSQPEVIINNYPQWLKRVRPEH